MVDEPIDLFRARPRAPVRNPDPGPTRDHDEPEVFFDRRELQTILNVYGRNVAAGEWRDYGIATGRDMVTFAVYRRTAEFPLYRIEKRPKLRAKQGMYSVVSVTGLILKRGHDLAQVLKVLEPKSVAGI
jgi:Protein of unknown function (DUF2794)